MGKMRYLKVFNFFRNLFKISLVVFILDILGYVFQNYLIIKKPISVYGLWNFDFSTEKFAQFILYYGTYSFWFSIMFSISIFVFSKALNFNLKMSNKIFKFIKEFLKVSDDNKELIYKDIIRQSGVYVSRKDKKIIVYIYVPFEREKRIYDDDTLRVLADDLVQRCRNYKGFERCSASMWQDRLYQNKKYKVLMINASM